MNYTLCTYEYPAAQHDVDEWDRKMTARGFVRGRFPQPGADVVELTYHPDAPVPEVAERLFLVRIIDGEPVEPGLQSFLRHLGPDRPFKFIHFGKVPHRSKAWRDLLDWNWRT